ncbi:phenylalanine--tRNA ligase beta subunit-related protein [uncultured Proteiniphilum sp.]|uniref:B3/B4 domain-containing protein n=1 Tax=uncultured Proteiniphilum sp. TaxID=497637 RepID=UPI00260D3E7B|nr:phenylalanine--tRNA ligase beta subunit-related protein [uncultured Proteiniphilum sp.]
MNTRNITISDRIAAICPEFHVAAIACKVRNSPHNTGLWQEIEAFCSRSSSTHKMGDINQRPAIHATRQVYKRLGKDPSRYRPSAEALCRRMLKGQELYRINTLVDLINLVSLKTGYSIGGFDEAKIQGDLVLGVGEAGEKFEAIGRGLLNIEGLPVYRDELGGIGTPTSDEERTKISSGTTRLLMLINGYSGKEGLQEATDYSADLLKKYAGAKELDIGLFNVTTPGGNTAFSIF